MESAKYVGGMQRHADAQQGENQIRAESLLLVQNRPRHVALAAVSSHSSLSGSSARASPNLQGVSRNQE